MSSTKWRSATATDSALARPAVATPAAAGSGFRPEIQALRAAAVLLVVGYHLWPGQIRGGFAGVDVFFVISGFLITGHLARELASEGTIRLPAFYARRARRLLPAALIVLLVSAVGVFALLPVTAWQRSFHEILASALYFENWSLAASSVDYFAAEDAPTLVQHFWSLSVEEQFYLGWPLLFLLGAGLARWLPDRYQARRGLALASVPALVLVLSFGWSALHHGSGAEYFSTFTRAWEFAAGGLLALASVRLRDGWAAVVMSWLGWAAVIATGLVLTSSMRFPGWVALFPVIGTVAVIAAGTPSGRFGPSRLIGNRAVQFTGGISYSLYLWHWPVIILFGREQGGTTDSDVSRLVLLALSLVLAVASTYLIEAPVRHTRFRGTGRTLGLAAAGMAVVSVVTMVGQARADNVRTTAERQVADVRANPPKCFGAAALDPRLPECRTANGTAESGAAESGTADRPGSGREPIPSPVVAFEDRAKTCMQALDKATLRICTTGPSASKATREVAVVGDSHAMAWMPALQQIAEQRGWRLIALLKQSCPLTEAVREMDAGPAQSCVTWNDAVRDWLVRHPGVDEVIVSASSKNEFVPDPGRSWQETAARGYQAAWNGLPASVERIVVLRDVPRPKGNVVSCSASAVDAGRDVRDCGRSKSSAVLEDPQVAAVEALTRSGADGDAEAAGGKAERSVELIDLNDHFCADGFCSPEVGGAFVYRDGHHLTATFARTLVPYLAAELAP